MAAVTADQEVAQNKRVNRFDSPWYNPKLITGVVIIVLAFSLEFIGPLMWDTDLARAASTPLNLPPVWVTGELGPGFGQPDPAHPLGTESSGRDMLALLLVGTPRSLRVGFIAAGIGMLVGIVLGFSAGYLGG